MTRGSRSWLLNANATTLPSGRTNNNRYIIEVIIVKSILITGRATFYFYIFINRYSNNQYMITITGIIFNRV